MQILNDRSLRATARMVERLDAAISGDGKLALVKLGFSSQTADAYRLSIRDYAGSLGKEIARYNALKNGDVGVVGSEELSDLGLLPILGRLAKGMTQSEFASLIGLKEQQVQRYEMETYRSIKLETFERILGILDIAVRGSFQTHKDQTRQLGKLFRRGTAASLGSDVDKWFELVRERATKSLGSLKGRFDPTDVSWIELLRRLSRDQDGPKKAVGFLREQGILFLTEQAPPGRRIDGCAFTVDSIPTVVLTLRYDRIDYFWFTLLHEIGHIFLHYSRLLDLGFVDSLENGREADPIELEADAFATESLVPPTIWNHSAVRFAKSIAPIRRFAEALGVHEAVVVGRLRKERSDYSLLAKHVGQGEVRRLFGQGESYGK